MMMRSLTGAGIAAFGALLLLGAAAAGARTLLSLEVLAQAGYVEVALDASRFRQDRVATIRITNKVGIVIEGEIPPCVTLFESADGSRSPLSPAEAGPFRVGPGRTIEVTRPFQLVQPGKAPPDGGTYRLSPRPLSHDLSKCRG
jgi:hypothetical protein